MAPRSPYSSGSVCSSRWREADAVERADQVDLDDLLEHVEVVGRVVRAVLADRALAQPMPAELTSTRSGPISLAVSTAAMTSSVLVTSAWQNAPPISVASALPLSSCSRRRRPWRRARRAAGAASPIPDAPPVTIALKLPLMSMGGDDRPDASAPVPSEHIRSGHVRVDRRGPLAGFTVVEATQMVSGPLAATICWPTSAPMSIKIEQPAGGDRMRYLGNRRGGIGALWASVNGASDRCASTCSAPTASRSSSGSPPRPMSSSRTSVPASSTRLGIDEAGVASRQAQLDLRIDLADSASRAVHRSEELRLCDPGAVGHGRAAARSRHRRAGVAAQHRHRQGHGDGRGAIDTRRRCSPATRGAGASMFEWRCSTWPSSFLWPDGMMQHTLLADDGRVTPGPHMADNYLVRRTAGRLHRVAGDVEHAVPRIVRGARHEKWLDDDPLSTLAAREANAEELHDLIAAELQRHPGPPSWSRLALSRCAVCVGEPHRPGAPRSAGACTTRSSSSTIAHGSARCANRGHPLHFSDHADRARPSRSETRRAHRRGARGDRPRPRSDRRSPGEGHHRSVSRRRLRRPSHPSRFTSPHPQPRRSETLV